MAELVVGRSGALLAWLVLVVLLRSYGGGAMTAEEQGVLHHHVVGDDQGWDVSSNLGRWSAGKEFKVGDSIWLTYSATKEGVAEVRSKEQFEACNPSNPIRMYTDGINEVVLDGEGHRYFISGDAGRCKEGLKLHVNVQPKSEARALETSTLAAEDTPVAAEGPSTSSAAAHLVLFSAQAWVVRFLVLCLFLGF